MAYKQPVSVLVLIHDSDLNVLIIERAKPPVFWQSVTGSVELGESLFATAHRELFEETGLVTPHMVDWGISYQYAIYPEYRHRYPPGISHNTEHVFSACVARESVIQLSPSEHTRWQWLPWAEASRTCRSWSNQAAIDQLPLRYKRD